MRAKPPRAPISRSPPRVSRMEKTSLFGRPSRVVYTRDFSPSNSISPASWKPIQMRPGGPERPRSAHRWEVLRILPYDGEDIVAVAREPAVRSRPEVALAIFKRQRTIFRFSTSRGVTKRSPRGARVPVGACPDDCRRGLPKARGPAYRANRRARHTGGSARWGSGGSSPHCRPARNHRCGWRRCK